MGDARGILQLPPAQEDDAKKKLAEQETAAINAVRRGWKHLLLPQEPQPAGPNAARAFDLETVELTNRGSDPMPLVQLAWKQCEDDGLIVSRLGVLDNDLGKVWQPDQTHVSVRQLRDWFAQFLYLSKLRDPQVLAKAISVVLVRRSAAEVQLAKQTPRSPEPPGGGGGTNVQPPLEPGAARRPRRFYAKIALDPNRPTPQVSNIAQSILSELDRAHSTKVTLTLDIDAESADGFPEDVQSVVHDNAVSLRIKDFGFEGE